MSGYSYTFTHTDYSQKEKPANCSSTPHNEPPTLERIRSDKVKVWVGPSPSPTKGTAKSATVNLLALRSTLLWSATAHDQGLKVKRHVVLILDPRYNWGERMFRAAPRSLPTFLLLTFLRYRTRSLDRGTHCYQGITNSIHDTDKS
jgi:hypothetical protein